MKKLLTLVLFWTLFSHLMLGQVIFQDGFESGSFDAAWTPMPNLTGADGIVEVTSENPFSGQYAARLGKTSDAGTYTTNGLDLHLDLSNYPQAELSFWIRDNGDETDIFDGLYFSDDGGVNFVKVFDFFPYDWCDSYYGDFPPFDIDVLAAKNGLSLTSEFVIRFQQYGQDDFDGSIIFAYDGIYIDSVSVVVPNIQYATLPFSDDFESGALGNMWKVGFGDSTSIPNTTNPTGIVDVVDGEGIANSHAVRFGKLCDGPFVTNALDLHLDLGGIFQAELSFWIRDYGDETHLYDGVYFSDDGGVNFKKVFDFDFDSVNGNQQYILDIDNLCVLNGLGLTDQFIVRIQQYGNDDFLGLIVTSYDGMYLDDVSVVGNASNTWYSDDDSDTFGDPIDFIQNPTQPAGYVSNALDCNDTDPNINPLATEACDGIDNNCNAIIDDGLIFSDYYPDLDSDGYGDNSAAPTASCFPISDFVINNDDCDDADDTVNPNATETCDGLDNNCDGEIDEGLLADFYPDMDGDSFGDASAAPFQECAAPPDFVDNNEDCDDTNPAINPGAAEPCDGLDNNCNSQIDEGLSLDYYPDIDNDGFGDNSALATSSCFPISDFVTNNGDCDDANDTVNPGADEICDGLDNDCDGEVDEGCSGIPDCSTIGISTTGNDLVVTGLDLQPISFVQVFDDSWNTLFQCFANCGGSLVQAYPNGTYHVFAKYFDSNYQQLCEKLETVVINGTNPPPPPPNFCDSVTYQPSPNQLNITNLDPAYIPEVQVFDLNWDSVYYCFGNCGNPIQIPLPANGYQIIFKYFNQNYGVDCERLDTVFVTDNLIGKSGQSDFEVIKHLEHAQAVWVHDNGVNTESYILQHSKDGVQYEDVMGLPAENSTRFELYEFYDLNPYMGDNYYRISIQKKDGSTEYSEVKKVNFPVLNPFTIFPNPANNFARIDLGSRQGQDVTLKIYNNLGVEVKRFEVRNFISEYYQMDLRDVREGHYVVWVVAEGTRPVARKMVVGK